MTQTTERDQGTDQGAFALTRQQIAFYETFGFLRLDGLFADDMDRITRGFEEAFTDETALRFDQEGIELHFHKPRQIVANIVSIHDDLSWLLQDHRILGLARDLIGDEFEYGDSDGNIFSCETSWHCDIYNSPLSERNLKLAFYLDPLDGDSGALRMMPGTNHYQTEYASHLRRDLKDHPAIPDVFGVDAREIPSWVVTTEPGDLVAMNFRTIHASFHGNHHRRLITMNYREPRHPTES